MLARGSFTVLSLRGVPIRLHWSVLFLIPLVVLGVQANAFALASALGLSPARLDLPAWGFGLVVAAGLLVSIALHELAHTLYALRFGGHVESIVLMALGGVSQITRMPARPRHELGMALAGPATSIGLAVGLGFGFSVTRELPDVALPLFLLAYANLALGLFNLAPAFPMDGGRVLRAALTGRLGRRRATRVAASVGKVMAVGFVMLGLLGGGVWLLLIAAFVWLAGSQEALHAELSGSLGRLTVGEVTHLAPRLPSTATLDDALVLMRRTGAESALVEEFGRTLGLVRLREVLAVPPQQRMSEAVTAHMLHTEGLSAGAPLATSYDRVLREGEVPVLDERGAPLGVVRGSTVLRELSRRNPKLAALKDLPPERDGRGPLDQP